MLRDDMHGDPSHFQTLTTFWTMHSATPMAPGKPSLTEMESKFTNIIEAFVTNRAAKMLDRAQQVSE